MHGFMPENAKTYAIKYKYPVDLYVYLYIF